MESAEWKKIFLHTENYPDILLEDLKRNPEMLEFVEGYNDVHKKSSEGLTFEERKKKLPLFIQWDKRWGYEPYGTSDIGISGCGPTCMAMVIYSLTRNTEATPPVLAQKSMNEGYYVEGIGTSWKFMREAALDYGVIASQFDMLGEQEMGIGEIIGGSQREDDYDKLLARINELGLSEDDYKFYLDLRKYGSARTRRALGLGFERCVMYLTGMGNIRDVIPFPRTVNNCEL